MTTTMTKSVFLKASCETVWAFLTDKDKLGEWYYPAEADLTLGQEYCLYRVDETDKKIPQITGRVLEIEIYKKLVTTFIIEPFKGNETVVTWELNEVAGGTRLLLTHEGIVEASGEAALHLLTALDKGWDEHFSEFRRSMENFTE